MITWMLVRVLGMPLLEKRYGNDLTYQEYKKQTNGFFFVVSKHEKGALMNNIFTPQFVKLGAVASTIFVIVDLIWLGVISSRLYSEQLGYLANLRNGAVTFNIPIGILTQVIIGLGLATIITLALSHHNSWVEAAFFGTLTGFVIYATYDFTNLSFIKDWPIMITVIDIAWGSFQGFLASIYVYWLFQRLF